MTQDPDSARALARKKRQAAALKANLKRRKDVPASEEAEDAAQPSHEKSGS